MKFLSQINVNTEYTLPIVDGNNGQVLTTDGNGAVYWGNVSAGVTNLDGLTDVILTSPSSGQLLRYGIPPGSGEANPVWYNFTPTYLTPSSSIDALSDVTISTATTGQILQWSGSQWVNATLSTVEYVSKVQHLVKCGVAVTKGQAVYVTTSDGTNMIVGLASNATEPTSSKVIGLAASTGAINDQIFVVTEGLIAGLNTSTATAGDPVWLGTNGNLIFGLLNKPVAPAHLVYLGVVTRVQQNNGEIFVNVQNGFELHELHDVLISSPSTGQLIRRDSDGLWKNWTPNYLTSLPTHNHDDRYYTETEIAGFFGGETPIAGYNQTNWDTAYNDKINSASFSTSTGVLTLTQQDSGTITVDLDGRYLESLPSHNHDDRYYTETESDSRFVNASGDTMSGSLSFDQAAVIKKRITQNGFNPVKTSSGVLTSISDNSSGYTYYVIETNVPQDDYQMGGFTIELFGRYGETNNKTKIDLAGYWNPESNSGFQGFEAHGTNPQYKPTIEVCRNSSGKTAFIIYGVSWSYPVIVARDLWLGYNSTDGGTYGEGWTITGTNDVSSYTNKDTVVWRNAYSDSNPAGYITGYTETDTLATVTSRGSSTTSSITINGTASITTDIVLTRSDTTPALVFTNQNGLRWVYSGGGNYWSTSLSIDSNNLINMGGSPLATHSWVQAQGYATQTWVGLNYYNEGEIDDFFSGAEVISGYNKSNWDTAYNDRITSAAVTGTSTKTLTLTQGDGGTVTATWTDYDTDNDAQVLTWTAPSKELEISNGNSITLDGLATEDYVLSQGFTTFQPWNSGTGSINYTAGNVGIGTASPNYKLDITGGSVRLTQDYSQVILNGITLRGYSADNLWVIGNSTRASINLGTSWDWDTQVAIAYTPNTPGAGQGGLAIGQTNKNSSTWTHGSTSFYTLGTERVTIDSSGNVGIGTTSPAEKLHVVGAAIFDGGAGNSSTDSVLYVTKSNSNDWGLYVNASGVDYGMYVRISPSAGYAFGIHNGTTWTTRITGDGRIHLNNKDTIASYDSWLRLNQSGEYTSGVYTPAGLRNDGTFENYGGIYGYNTIRGRKAQTNNNYTTAALWTESYDNTTTGIAFHISGNVGKFLEMRTDGVLYWENAKVWTAGNDGAASGLDADLLDGQHGSYYQPASTAITTSNIGSQNVNYAEYTNRTYRGIIEDTRSAQRTPNGYDDYRVSWEFTDQITGIPDWHSVMTMQGWHDGYAAWQIIGPSSTTAHENWYLRSGNTTTWNTLRRIWHNGDFSSTNISNWNAAYNDRITAVAVSGTGTKTLTLTQQDGGTLTATWTDYDTDNDAQTLSWDQGQTLLSISGGNDVTLTGLATEDYVNSQGFITSVPTPTKLVSPNGATVVAADSALPDAGHSFIHTLALGPGGNDGHILGMTWASTTSSYGAQIFIDTDPTSTMAFRSRSSAGVWTAWTTLVHSGNIGSQSVAYATSAGSATSASTATTVTGQSSISYAAHSAGANDYNLELYSSDTGDATKYVSLRFHQGSRYWGQIRYNNAGFRLTGGADDSLNNIYAGIYYATGGNSSQWNTAYGWGNHASAGYITASYLDDYTRGAYRVISDYNGNTTWYIRSNGQFIWGNGHDWTQSFRLNLSHSGGANAAWAYFGQQDSNETNGRYRGVRIRKYASGTATDGDISAAAYYIGDTRKDGNWDTAYGWGNHADAPYWNVSLNQDVQVEAQNVTFAGNVIIQGTLTESSSIRFKENIQPLEPALAKVEQLNPVTYTKITSQEEEIGLIAEEVAELFPEVVTYNESGQPQGIQYQRLSVILLKAVQELTERVNKLENK